MLKRLVFKIVVTLIRKYFPEGVQFDENILAYSWTWTKDAEDLAFGRGKNDI